MRLQDVILRDTRSAQPSGPGVAPGTIYGVSDEGNRLERWDGAAWAPFSPVGADLSTVVPITRTVNGHPLSADVLVTKADVGLALVENTALSTWAGSTALVTTGTLAALSVTAPIVGSLAGNAATATRLQTPRLINGVAFDGTADITVAGGGGGGGTWGSITGTLAAQTDLQAALDAKTRDAITVTSTDALVLQNTTPATGGVPVQMSPRLRFRSQVWNTTSGATNTDDWWIEALPVTSAAPSSTLRFWTSQNGATAANPLVITPAGTLTVLGSLIGFALQAASIGNIRFASRTILTAAADAQLTLTNSAASAGVGLDITTDAVLKVRTRAHTGYASLTSGASGIAAVSTDGHVLENDTLATVGVPVQWSPRLRFRGHVWNSTTTATNTSDFWLENVPASGTTPSAILYFRHSLNGAAATSPFYVKSDGTVGVSVVLNLPASQFGLSFGGSGYFGPLAAGCFNLQTNAGLGVGFDVTTDTLVKIRTRNHGAFASLQAYNLTATNSALGTTGSSDGLVLENLQAASAITAQMSPRLRFRGAAWNTGTVSSYTDEWWIESLPASGATPSAALRFLSSINGGVAVAAMVLTNTGFPAALPTGTVTAGRLQLFSNVGSFLFGPNGVRLNGVADGQITLTNSGINLGVGLDVATDAVLKVRTRAQSAYASVEVLDVNVMRGVLFPATQNPSSDPNTLDDYEEGTFTPTIAFGGAAVGVTYGVQSGSYIKIGKFVSVSLRVTLTSKGSSVGTATIEGLPFASGPTAGAVIAPFYAAFAAGVFAVMGYIGGTSIQPTYGTAAAATLMTDASFTSGSDVMFVGTYQAGT